MDMFLDLKYSDWRNKRMNKISIDAFLREYSVAAKQNENVIKAFIKKHITNNYVSFFEKCVYCDSIVKASCHIKEGDKEIVKFNSPNRYVGFTMRLLDLYTDLEIDFKDGEFVNQYDKLNAVNAINYLINGIPENEYAEFTTILNMKLDDFRDNEYSVAALIYNLKESFVLTRDIIDQVLESDEVKTLIEESETVNEDENK